MAGLPGAQSPHEAYYLYYGKRVAGRAHGALEAAFSARLPYAGRRPGGKGGVPVPYQQAKIGLSLFDLETDPGEVTDVAAAHPDVVAKIRRLADQARAELGDSATRQVGAGVREPGWIDAGDLRFDWEPGKPLDVTSPSGEGGGRGETENDGRRKTAGAITRSKSWRLAFQGVRRWAPIDARS